MATAIIHDWLTGMRGGERCLEVLSTLVQEPTLYTMFYEPRAVSAELRALDPVIGPFGRLPGVNRYYRYLLPFYPIGARAIGRQLKYSSTRPRIVLSVSHCLAKNVPIPFDIPHLCYCLTPMRYLWDQYDRYFAKRRLEPFIRQVIELLRDWDRSGAERVTHFVAISEFVRRRIQRVYGREADVIYPPVRTHWLAPLDRFEPGEGFLVVNALVPYKNTDLIVETFTRLRLPLTVVGSGPEEGRLKRLAGSNVRFLGRVSDTELAQLYRRSKALVFAAVEDFGMAPVEMMATGRPVIALAQGGVLETVSTEPGNETGVLFSDLTHDAIAAAIHDFLNREHQFKISACVARVELFSLRRFREQFRSLLSRLGFADSLVADDFPDGQALRAARAR